jgi:2-deoxy-D-gluconate 3-dehydrogenase
MDSSIKDFSMDFFSLKGKVAIVTGGNTNLGLAYSVAFAKAGADLFIPHFEDDISDAKEAIEAEGQHVVFLKGDLVEPEYRKSIIAECIKAYGRIDILVNNAGISIHGSLEEYEDEWYQKMIEVDLNVCYYLCREVGLKMRELGNGGKIINIGSALSFTGSGGGMPYPIAKHAVIGLTRAMAAGFLDDDIQVNAVCPGFFHSPVNKGIPQEGIDAVGKRLKGRVWGKFGDMMGSVVFLASGASDYVTGTYIVVDGGFAANYI